MKAEMKITVMRAALFVALLIVAGLIAGCALERADPAARSNRATYTISVVAEGGSTATAYISDGLMATADGEGAITQPARQSAEQSPEVTVPGDAVTAGIQAVGHVVGKGIDAVAASQAAKTQSDANPTPTDANAECADCKDPAADCKDCVVK